MATIVTGDRVGQQSTLAASCSAAVFDATQRKVLLTRRADNGRWCLPGGRMEPGESVAEACAREIWEETGLQVTVGRLIGVYTSPHYILTYPDGNRWQVVGFHLAATPMGGELRLSDETTEYGYFTPDEIAAMDVMETDRERITDTFAAQIAAFVR